METRDVRAIIDFPMSVTAYLKGLETEDKNMLVFTLFWAMTDTFQHMDMDEGTYENYCASQFAQWGNDYYLETLDTNNIQEQREFDRLFTIFEAFNRKLDRANVWRSLGQYFYNTLDRHGLVDGNCSRFKFDSVMYDVEVYAERRVIEITVTGE